MRYRVILWGTGFVGKMALEALLQHPDFELAGLVVSDPKKVGVDAGELVGLPRTGVRATDDVAAACAIEAHACAYFANADLRPKDAVTDMAHMLAAGKNVVSSSVATLVWPKTAPPSLVTPLERACRDGGTSCFTTGIDPGFANDLIPLTLLGLCARVETVRIQEILDYSTYPNPKTLFEIMGFGQPLDAKPILLMPGVLSLSWAGVVYALAEGLGVKLDEVREVHERAPAPHDIVLPLGRVPKGTSGGLRFELQGIVAGRPRIIVEHVTRMHPDVAPQWPGSATGDLYRILIDGDPSISADLAFRGADGDPNRGGCLSTGMRALNAIPAVVDAPPGVLTLFDLPLVPGHGTMR